MSKIRPIEQIGSPVLCHRADEIGWGDRAALQESISDLIATAKAASGVGIAAPQVGLSLRLFIIASRPSPRYPYAPTMEPTAIVNPQIIDRSGEIVMGWEGCLSVPGVRGLVPRDRAIEVTYFTADGQFVQRELTDFIARIFQHELDHLDGILFPDRVLKPTDLIPEAEYQKIAFD
jgi:peptide deformylase